MLGCYVEVVFKFAKARHHPNFVPVLFSVLIIYIYIYIYIYKEFTETQLILLEAYCCKITA